MSIDVARITRKTEQASLEVTNTRTFAATLAADPSTTAEQWGMFANRLAEAEGKAEAWARLAYIVDNRGGSIDKAGVKEIAFSLLVNGADDSWSGRGNDVKRARFDGIRAASSDMQWL